MKVRRAARPQVPKKGNQVSPPEGVHSPRSVGEGEKKASITGKMKRKKGGNGRTTPNSAGKKKRQHNLVLKLKEK